MEDLLAVAAAVTGAVPPGSTTAGPGPPGGLDPDTSDRLASCLARTVGWMFHARDQGRTAHLTLACLNHWLAEYGPDLPAERLAAIHTEVFPYIRRTWQDNRLPRLKVGPRRNGPRHLPPPSRGRHSVSFLGSLASPLLSPVHVVYPWWCTCSPEGGPVCPYLEPSPHPPLSVLLRSPWWCTCSPEGVPVCPYLEPSPHPPLSVLLRSPWWCTCSPSCSSEP